MTSHMMIGSESVVVADVANASYIPFSNNFFALLHILFYLQQALWTLYLWTQPIMDTHTHTMV